MPIYDYVCQKCGQEYHNVKRSMDERRTHAPKCCEERTQIIIRPTRAAFMDYFEPYRCPVTDKPVTSKRERQNIMAKHNLVEHGEIRLRSVSEY